MVESLLSRVEGAWEEPADEEDRHRDEAKRLPLGLPKVEDHTLGVRVVFPRVGEGAVCKDSQRRLQKVHDQTRSPMISYLSMDISTE